ncbi:MAG: hypothetical protein ACP5JV_06840 [Thermus sp.]|uniref:hypothetical protein n=1 Tax=Thermus sp. TaxID=275 RepID=UPI003D0B162C
MRLRPEARKAAEEKLKRPIPEPDEPGFYALLEEVRAFDPELAALLEEGIEFEQVKPPEEEVKREVKKRALLRDLYNRLLNRYDELTGEWVPSRPKQILVGVGAFLGLVVFMWSMNSLGGPKRAAPATATASQVAPAQQGHLEASAPPSQGPVGTGSPQAAAQGPEGPSQGEAAGESPQGQAPGQGSTGTPQAPAGPVPPPPTPAPTGEVPPPPAPSGAYPAGAGALQADLAPAMTLYLRPAAQEGAAPAPGLALYTRPGGGEDRAEKGPTLAVPLSGGGGSAQAPSLALYTRSGEDKGQAPPMASFVAYQKREAPQAQASPPPPPSEPGLFARNLPDIFGPGASASGPGAPPPGNPGASSPGKPNQAAPGEARPYLPGTRLPGRLAVKLVVPEGQEVPVALETEDGATFLGKAKLSPTRRVEVNLDQAVLAGKVYPLKAVVLGADLAQGLPAQVREEAPSLVADLVRGSLRGLSDYVRARSQQTTITTTPGGTVIQQGQAPPLELFLGAAAADLFSVPEGTRAVVRVAEVQEGTPLTVLVLQ